MCVYLTGDVSGSMFLRACVWLTVCVCYYLSSFECVHSSDWRVMIIFMCLGDDVAL